MKSRYIYGCGGVGLELFDVLNTNGIPVEGFIDDNAELTEVCGVPVVRFKEFLNLEKQKEAAVIISMGEPTIRIKLSKLLEENGCIEEGVDFSEYHSSIDTYVGEGTILHISSVLSVNAKVGRSCMVNKRVIVGHDCNIGDYTVLSPGVILGGNVTVGNNCFIGTGAFIRNGISIGDNSIIGMGAVVTKDVEEGVVVVGNPAKIIRKNDTGKVFGHK